MKHDSNMDSHQSFILKFIVLQNAIRYLPHTQGRLWLTSYNLSEDTAQLGKIFCYYVPSWPLSLSVQPQMEGSMNTHHQVRPYSFPEKIAGSYSIV